MASYLFSLLGSPHTSPLGSFLRSAWAWLKALAISFCPGRWRAMAPRNIFSFLEGHRSGQPRARLCEAQLTLMRLQLRWEFPHALPRGSQSVKDIVQLSKDAFCLVHKGGRSDAYSAKDACGPDFSGSESDSLHLSGGLADFSPTFFLFGWEHLWGQS